MLGQGLGRGEGGESEKGIYFTWGLFNVERGCLGEEVLEVLSRGMRRDGLACRRQPYMFFFIWCAGLLKHLVQ